jgi:carboxyl-terminal processing protease
MILKNLGDNHSFLQTAEDNKKWSNIKTDNNKKAIPYAKYELLDNQFGYIQMFGFSSGNNGEGTAFADSLHKIISFLDKSTALKGWIVDLRDNTGGNCWPMLAGIGPILGEGVAGYFTIPNKSKKPWEYKKGASMENNIQKTKVSQTIIYKTKNDLPIAVLSSERTASSGEVTLVSFKNHPRAKVFGEPSGGYSTGNQNYMMSDSSQLVLTVSVYADRKENLYGSNVPPDELVKNPEKIRDIDKDPVLEVAKNWLLKQ